MPGVVTGARRRSVTWALLDRDGTINEKAAEGRYISRASDVRLIRGAALAVRRMNEALDTVVVVTNQRGVARGLLTPAAVLTVNARVADLLGRVGGHIDGFFVCPHDCGRCQCRKPAPGLLRAASERYASPLDRAVVIGDAETDVEAGNAVGALTIRIALPGTASKADYVAPALSDAVDLLLECPPL